ncbi:hypothetical protein MRX96_020519 [Rhipicephalus microplus]
MAASTPAALDEGCDDNDSMDFRETDAHDLATLRNMNTTDTRRPRQEELNGDWQVALTLHQRKAQARERK